MVITVFSDNCSSLTGWTLFQYNGATVTQVTFDGKSTFKFDVPSGALRVATIDRQIFTKAPDLLSFSVKTYFTYLQAWADNQDNYVTLGVATNYGIRFAFASDGLYSRSSDPNYEIGVNLVQLNTWQLWKFVIDTVSKTCDIYLDGVLKAEGVAFVLPEITQGYLDFNLYNQTGASATAYVDSFLVTHGQAIPIITMIR